ncbi:hypothetical protein IKQ19_08110 [Candidatus Saccharibacteria bacterium]|nr:hypothetical protein [Candidatus Saccharibacteria bacterium]
MGLLGDIFNGIVRITGEQMERNANTAHKAAQSGYYNGRRLSEQGREKMRMMEQKFRDNADRASSYYNAHTQPQNKDD